MEIKKNLVSKYNCSYIIIETEKSNCYMTISVFFSVS